MQGKATWLQLLKNWFFSFFGNLAGSLFIVWLVDETFLFQTGPLSGVANAKAVAVSKTSAAFGTTVVRGLLCNWLVSSCPFLISPHNLDEVSLLIWDIVVHGQSCKCQVQQMPRPLLLQRPLLLFALLLSVDFCATGW